MIFDIQVDSDPKYRSNPDTNSPEVKVIYNKNNFMRPNISRNSIQEIRRNVCRCGTYLMFKEYLKGISKV